jgi:glyoxylase-like metal-dependent hydrolase (beta-lactamase superfamily II)
MRLGDMEIRHIHSGNFYLDGGAMFGVVPKPLWEKKSPPDSRNRIRLAANSLLVRAANKNILIETGNGTKWTPKLRDIYAIDEGDPLTQNLATAGVSPSQVDLVINTHLHFDHAGGNTKLLDDHAVPSFPNAQYIVQAEELAHAANATERDRASYFEDNFLPMRQSGQWKLISGDTEILPGISVVRTPGHNTSIQAVQLTGGGKTVFFVADLFPTRHHLPLAWIMAYDLYPLQTLDPDVSAATVYERENKVAFEPVDLNR